MYRVIAYHGTGERSEMQHDLQALWCNLRHFSETINVKHIYCFQEMNENKETNLLLVLQYGNMMEERVDYWFYLREGQKLDRSRRW